MGCLAEKDFRSAQVGHLAIAGNCPHRMLPGVVPDGQGELRLASGSAVLTAAGELKEPRCEPPHNRPGPGPRVTGRRPSARDDRRDLIPDEPGRGPDPSGGLAADRPLRPDRGQLQVRPGPGAAGASRAAADVRSAPGTSGSLRGRPLRAPAGRGPAEHLGLEPVPGRLPVSRPRRSGSRTAVLAPGQPCCSPPHAPLVSSQRR